MPQDVLVYPLRKQVRRLRQRVVGGGDDPAHDQREEGDADGVRDDVERHHGEDGAGGLVRDRDVAGVTRVSPI